MTRKRQEPDTGEPKKKYINLVLSPEQHEEIRKAGEVAGRNPTQQALFLATGGQGTPAPSPFAGWPAADAEAFQGMGDAVALLLRDVSQRAGTATPLKRRLGYLSLAIEGFLDAVGAEEASSEDEQFFRQMGRGLALDEPLKTVAASLGLSREEGALAGIARRLGTQPNTEAADDVVVIAVPNTETDNLSEAPKDGNAAWLELLSEDGRRKKKEK